MRIGKAFIKGRGVVLAVMEPNFLMGSMGYVVGEKLCLAVEKAIEEKFKGKPVLIEQNRRAVRETYAEVKQNGINGKK